MRICVIGTGYVGLVAGACLAEMGNTVTCVDNDEDKLTALRGGLIPIYEPGLEELVRSNTRDGRLSFTDDLASSVREAEITFIAVGTPQSEDGAADLHFVLGVAGEIGRALATLPPQERSYKVIVDKSTVPVGTAARVRSVIASHYDGPLDVVSNPEFLKQGAAVDNFMKPDRVVIGADSKEAAALMQDLYAPFMRTGHPVIIMDVKSAELTKYAANCFLALKISYANEIANLCESLGADCESVRAGVGADPRIGSRFLFPGLGYGGSCFPKDVRALIKTAHDLGAGCSLLEAADRVNFGQRDLFINKVIQRFADSTESGSAGQHRNLTGLTFAVWGLSFKPNTDDLRMAPSLTIIPALLKQGARVKAYDPKALLTARAYFGDAITYTQSAYEALEGADALLLLTEWNEFRRPDFRRIKELLKQPLIFDGRNQYDPARLSSLGFDYYCLGRPGTALSRREPL
ncbi:MAG: UDP-glucose/GDP-mannose dehydrogenase family protein [Succinivibrio sp.]|nr:UDP-glucose/GDP-mannose dehydrogenase family protein [Succinivibrio sp.]